MKVFPIVQAIVSTLWKRKLQI